MSKEEENNLKNIISEEFHKARINHGIAYVLQNSETIVKEKCHLDLDNPLYKNIYEVVFNKFKNKYEVKYQKELEEKLSQTFEGYRGTYGLNYVIENSEKIAKRVCKNEFDTEIYRLSLNKFIQKYHIDNPNKSLKKENKSNNKRSKFPSFIAFIGGMSEGFNRNK